MWELAAGTLLGLAGKEDGGQDWMGNYTEEAYWQETNCGGGRVGERESVLWKDQMVSSHCWLGERRV